MNRINVPIVTYWTIRSEIEITASESLNMDEISTELKKKFKCL